MKKIYLIIYYAASDNEILRERIKSQGRFFSFWNNHWLVETDKSASDLYKTITADSFNELSILISEFNKKEYWGRMDKKLWEWLKQK